MESYLPAVARAKICRRFVLYGNWRFGLRGARRRVVLCRDLPTVIERKRTFRKLVSFGAAFSAAALLLCPWPATARRQAPAGAQDAALLGAAGSTETGGKADAGFQQSPAATAPAPAGDTQAPPAGALTKRMELAPTVESTRAIR